MRSKFIGRRASTLDAHGLSMKLRSADLAEIGAYSGNSPLVELLRPFADSNAAVYSVVGPHGNPLGMFGVSHTARARLLGFHGCWVLMSYS